MTPDGFFTITNEDNWRTFYQFIRFNNGFGSREFDVHPISGSVIMLNASDSVLYHISWCNACPQNSHYDTDRCRCNAGFHGALGSPGASCKECSTVHNALRPGFSCPPGFLRDADSSCDPDSPVDTSCHDCGSLQCAQGEYRTDDCDGNGELYLFFPGCAPCKTSCPSGTYMNPLTTCDGNGMSDVVECIPCKKSCGVGEFLHGTCDGLGKSDDTRCWKCKECPVDTYTQGPSICDGRSRMDTVVCTACTLCDTCMENPHVGCLTYTSRCTGAETSDVSECSACAPECSEDQYLWRACSSGINDYYCAACSHVCPDGSFIAMPCTAEGDSVCEVCRGCGENEFNEGYCTGFDSNDTTSCRNCTVCEEYDSPCTPTADSVCAQQCYLPHSDACMPGTFAKEVCDGGDEPCSPCLLCNRTEFINGTCNVSTNGAVCSQCSTSCGPGMYISSPCTLTTDVTCEKCKACPRGSYATGLCDGSANLPCTACAHLECPKGWWKDDALCNETKPPTCMECDGTEHVGCPGMLLFATGGGSFF